MHVKKGDLVQVELVAAERAGLEVGKSCGPQKKCTKIVLPRLLG
jgi:hypothetical protein